MAIHPERIKGPCGSRIDRQFIDFDAEEKLIIISEIAPRGEVCR